MNDPDAIDGLLEDLPDVITTDEAAQLMRVQPSTVIRWADELGLNIISIGPRIRRIRKEDLRAFLLRTDELSG